MNLLYSKHVGSAIGAALPNRGGGVWPHQHGGGVAESKWGVPVPTAFYELRGNLILFYWLVFRALYSCLCLLINILLLAVAEEPIVFLKIGGRRSGK
jgi:hypothetical protein